LLGSSWEVDGLKRAEDCLELPIKPLFLKKRNNLKEVSKLVIKARSLRLKAVYKSCFFDT
jgi:hypothetical protein